jgi:hypothetical protein
LHPLSASSDSNVILDQEKERIEPLHNPNGVYSKPRGLAHIPKYFLRHAT